MKKIGLITLLFISLWTTKTHATSGRSTAFSLELWGRGGSYSLNLDHLFFDRLALGLGAEYWSTSTQQSVIVPVYFNFYFKNSESRFYFTAGSIVTSGPATLFTSNAANIGLGYEYRSGSGFLFRAAAYYWLGYNFNNYGPIWGGLSLGYAF